MSDVFVLSGLALVRLERPESAELVIGGCYAARTAEARAADTGCSELGTDGQEPAASPLLMQKLKGRSCREKDKAGRETTECSKESGADEAAYLFCACSEYHLGNVVSWILSAKSR